MGIVVTPRHLPERRAFCRRQPAIGSWLRHARVRAGREVAVLDVSGGGALVECRTRLLPGISIELQLLTPKAVRRVPARVVRCQVANICPVRGVMYRAGLAFDPVLAPIEGVEL